MAIPFLHFVTKYLIFSTFSVFCKPFCRFLYNFSLCYYITFPQNKSTVCNEIMSHSQKSNRKQYSCVKQATKNNCNKLQWNNISPLINKCKMNAINCKSKNTVWLVNNLPTANWIKKTQTAQQVQNCKIKERVLPPFCKFCVFQR